MDRIIYNNLKWAGILMFAGGVIFWMGAFCPPYKQWMTKDIKEYLFIVNNFKTNWYIIHSLFLTGIIHSVFGIQIFSSSIQMAGRNPVFAMIGNTAFLIGSIFWILNIAFRLTVTIDIAEEFSENGQLKDWFQIWTDWSNLIFGIFMFLSYFGIGCLGYALLNINLFPSWVSWFCTVFGFAGAVSYLFQFPVFTPPLMIYLPVIITGLTIILKKSQFNFT